MDLGYYSYLTAAVTYGLFALLLVFSWRESRQGKLLLITMLLSAVWALLASLVSLRLDAYLLAYQLFEILRFAAWYVFLLKLFELAGDEAASYQRFVKRVLPQCLAVAGLLLLNEVLATVYSFPGQYVAGIAGKMVLSLIGLAIIEQLYRNTAARHRWSIKYLFLGAGGLFAYDFYLYADALLFHSVDQNLWQARGIVHVMVLPMLVLASARNRDWSLNVFVSRDIVLSTTAILGGGFYLLLMAGAGYYIREFGGDWGEVLQVAFFVLALVFLLVVLSSARLRAQLKVFLGKHFYKNKYDYRLEWLQLTEGLNDTAQDNEHYRTAIKAMAQMVDARAGLLWLRDERDVYQNVEAWKTARVDKTIASASDFVQFLNEKNYVINLDEIESHGDEYAGLDLPRWLPEIEQAWLIVPLYSTDDLLGFVVLCKPLVKRAINWEDRDLLKTAAKQIASYLTVLMTSAKLAEAKQFEVFSRLSAYMVHDLKNIAAELELVAINSKKHANNPEFIQDAFATVDNSAADIRRMLEQLRNRRSFDEKKVQVELAELVQGVVASRQHLLPAPRFNISSEVCIVPIQKGRFCNVLTHLIDNAQQATPDDGEISVTIASIDGMCSIEISDTGCGMDDTFVRNRLFKPFDTTKGNAGMGIGMHESRDFIRQLGGDIYVKSQPGKGSIISLHIPLRTTPDSSVEPARQVEQ